LRLENPKLSPRSLLICQTPSRQTGLRKGN
jgi:hypothetical protein